MSGATLPQPSTLARFAALCAISIKRTFVQHIPLYVCAIVFGIATVAIVVAYHIPLPLEASTAFLELVPKFLVLGIALGAAHRLFVMMRSGSKERPFTEITRWLSSQFLANDRPGNVFHSLIALMPLMVSFAALKDEIPQLNPFSWDQTFMHWDRLLGFGILPWQILQPIVGYPIVTAALNATYDSWFLVMFGFLFWQAFSSRGTQLRMQFLFAFALEWFIGGNLLAAVFSSAGPCFYGHFFSPDPYAAQIAYLHQANLSWPIWSVQIQGQLWQSYATGSGVVSGISAMPSMHVMSSTIMALLAWRKDRRLGIALTTYTGLIVIGSIALAWHYAVDSVAAIALGFAFWAIAGAILKWTAPRQAAV